MWQSCILAKWNPFPCLSFVVLHQNRFRLRSLCYMDDIVFVFVVSVVAVVIAAQLFSFSHLFNAVIIQTKFCCCIEESEDDY